MTPLAVGAHDHGAGTPVLASLPFLVLIGAGYAYAAVLAGQPTHRPGGRTPTRRVVAWYAGLAVVAAALLPPLGGSHAVSAHMLQHELLLTVAPLLLVAGLDRRVTRPLARRLAPARRTGAGGRVVALLRSPVVATALWVAVVLGWHLPPVYDASLDDAGLHLARQASLLAAGVVFWLVVVGRGPAARTAARQIAALGVAMAASGVLGAVLIWADTVVYPRHADAGWNLSPLQDQRLAGIVMMALDMPVLLGALLWVVARWARQQPDTAPPTPTPTTPGVARAVRPEKGAPWPST